MVCVIVKIIEVDMFTAHSVISSTCNRADRKYPRMCYTYETNHLNKANAYDLQRKKRAHMVNGNSRHVNGFLILTRIHTICTKR